MAAGIDDGKVESYLNGIQPWRRVKLLIYLLLVLGPLLAMLFLTGRSLAGGETEWLSLIIPTGRRLELFLTSIKLAAAVSLSGMALGILAGSRLWCMSGRAGLSARWLVLLFAALPPYIHALAWTRVFHALAVALPQLGLPAVSLQGSTGAWWVQTMALAPLAVALALIGLESVDPGLLEAGRVLKNDLRTFIFIALPLAAPMLIAGGSLLFILCLLDYSVPALFYVNVYALEIFAEHSATNEPARAFLLAAPLMAVAAVVVVGFQSALRSAVNKPSYGLRPWAGAPFGPPWFRWLQRLALFVLALQLFVPLFALLAAAGGAETLRASLSAARNEIDFSFAVAAVAALLVLPLALTAAAEMLKREKGGRLWWLLVTLPLAIPPPLVGIGLIAVWNRSLAPGIYGSSLMPVLAALTRFTPYAAIVMLAQLRRHDPLLLDAARIQQPSPLSTWLKIRLPMLLPGLLGAAGVVFALALGELGATLIVAPPGQATLTMRIYNLLHYGATDMVAGLCLVMAAVTVTAAFLAFAAILAWSRLFAGGETKR